MSVNNCEEAITGFRNESVLLFVFDPFRVIRG